MEADAAYQGCLKSCELHSRSLAIGRTGACDLEIAHTCYAISRLRICVTQSRDCAYVLRNLEIAHACYAIPRLPAQSRDSENSQRNLEIAQILRLRGTYTYTMLWSSKSNIKNLIHEHVNCCRCTTYRMYTWHIDVSFENLELCIHTHTYGTHACMHMHTYRYAHTHIHTHIQDQGDVVYPAVDNMLQEMALNLVRVLQQLERSSLVWPEVGHTGYLLAY